MCGMSQLLRARGGRLVKLATSLWDGAVLTGKLCCVKFILREMRLVQIAYFFGSLVSLLASGAFEFRWISLTQSSTLALLLFCIWIKIQDVFCEPSVPPECLASFSTSATGAKSKRAMLRRITLTAVLISLVATLGSAVARLPSVDIYGIYAGGARAGIPLLSCGRSDAKQFVHSRLHHLQEYFAACSSCMS